MIFTSNLLANLCFVSVCVVCVFECVVFVRGSAGARQWTYPIFISLFYCGQDSSLRRAPATHTYARTHTWTHTQMFGCILDHFLMFLFSFLPFFCSRYVSEAPSSLSPYDFDKNTHTHKHTHVHTRCWLIDRTKEKIRMEEQQRNWHQREYIGTTMTWMGIENTMNPPAHWWKLPEKLHSIISWQLIRSQLQN